MDLQQIRSFNRQRNGESLPSILVGSCSIVKVSENFGMNSCMGSTSPGRSTIWVSQGSHLASDSRSEVQSSKEWTWCSSDVCNLLNSYQFNLYAPSSARHRCQTSSSSRAPSQKRCWHYITEIITTIAILGNSPPDDVVAPPVSTAIDHCMQSYWSWLGRWWHYSVCNWFRCGYSHYPCGWGQPLGHTMAVATTTLVITHLHLVCLSFSCRNWWILNACHSW